MFRLIIILFSFISMLLALCWGVTKPGFDSWGGFIVAIIALLMSFRIPKNESSSVTKIQKVSDNSIGIQGKNITGLTINKRVNNDVDS